MEKEKHLEFLQNTITRMSTHSFQMKGYAVTLVAAFLAVYASTSNRTFIFLAMFPTVLFWFLDSYYLQQERKFRGIYEDVAGLTNMFAVKPYEMPAQKYQKQLDPQFSFWNAFFSKTILYLYLAILVSLLAMAAVLN